jgi:hypothetical protein
MKAIRAFAALVFLLLVSLPGVARAVDCLSGTVTATETPPNSGVWKYCISLTYDVTAIAQSPSHFSLILGALAECPCACNTGVFGFETPAGTSPGTDQGTALPCTVEYEGVFACDGDPTLPQFPGLALKWEVPAGTCEPDLTGTGTFCFLSLLPPGASSSTTAVIKLGQSSCSGTVTGTLPSCNCPTHVRPGTWGRLKALYR